MEKEVKILYTNWQGETRIRTLIPKEITFIETPWHGEAQWCLKALDVEKGEERTFACKDIRSWFLA